MKTKESILRRDWSRAFIDVMQNRMVVSHYKYGWVSDTYPDIGDAIASLEQRIKKYKETGNTEWLIDAANFAMIEFMHPRHKNAHFRGTDSDESPGIVGGSYNEMMREVEENEF